MTTKRLNIAIIGLGFGAEFIPIYQKYPHANLYAVCQRNREKAEAIAKAFGIEKVYTDYEELLKDPSPKGRKACGLYRTHGHDRRRMPTNRGIDPADWFDLHDDGDGYLQPGISICEGNV